MSETIFRIQKNADNPFVMIDKRIFTDKKLSYRAKGVLGYLLSRPDNWLVNMVDVANQSTEGRDAVITAVNELMKHGYVERLEHRDKGRFSHYEYLVYEVPKPVVPSDDTAHWKTVNGKSVNGLSVNGKSATTNKDITKKDLTNKKDISSGTPKKQKPKSASLEKPCDVTEQTWHDLLALRKAKKSPLTISAWNIAKKQIDEAQAKTGHTLEQVLLVWIERGWQGFMAKWYFNHINAQNTQNTQGNHNAINQPTFAPTQQQSSHETYSNNLMAELERELAKHGNQCPPNDSYCGNVYDMETPV